VGDPPISLAMCPVLLDSHSLSLSWVGAYGDFSACLWANLLVCFMIGPAILAV